MKFIFSVSLFFISTYLVAQQPIKSITLDGITVPVFDFPGLEPAFQKNNDTLYIFNFWATWCAPCVKELPAFVEASQQYKNQPVKIVLISLDFPEHIESRLIPFLNSKEMELPVWLLDDSHTNTWIPKLDASWTGAIPATIFIKGDRKMFVEKSLHTADIQKIVQSFFTK